MDEEIQDARHLLQVTTFANTAMAMCSVLAARMHQLGQLDEETVTQLRALLQQASRSVELCDPLAQKAIARFEGWLE